MTLGHCLSFRAIRRIIPACGLLAAVAATAHAEGTPARAMPKAFRAPQAGLREVEPPENTASAWRTEHLLILSDDPIDTNRIRRFATTVESVPGVFELLPLPLAYRAGRDVPVIRLCRDEDSFAAHGGPRTSAGFHDGRKNSVLIRADLLLNPQRGGESNIAEPPEEDLLVHEMSHLVTAEALGHARPWLTEGLAEYLAIAHRQGGHYRFDQSPRSIRDHFRRHLAFKDLDNLELPTIASVLELSYRDWERVIAEAEPEDRYLPYATALLFVHYHLEGGAERRAELAAHIAGHKDRRRRSGPAAELRLDEKTGDTIARFWASHGIRLRFVESGER